MKELNEKNLVAVSGGTPWGAIAFGIAVAYTTSRLIASYKKRNK